MNTDLSIKIRKNMVRAINDFNMIAEDDQIMVAVSGGKDSTAMLLLLREIQKKSPKNFSITPVILDQKQPGFNLDQFSRWLKERDFNLEVISEDTYSVVKEKTAEGKSYCGLCSRLRRGILYTHAKKMGFTKIALGHHRDDLNETLLMNVFYSGRIAAMPPVLKADDGYNTVIRPLCYVPEDDIRKLSLRQKFPIIPCNLCGSQSGLKRNRIKSLLKDLAGEDDNVGAKVLAAQQNIRPSQLMDSNLYSF